MTRLSSEHRLKELTKACKKSKDTRVITRVQAVRMVLVNHKSIADTAKDMAMDVTWVKSWIARFGERYGEPFLISQIWTSKAGAEIMREIINDKLPYID